MNKITKLAATAFVAVFFANNSIADNEGISIGFWGAQLDLDTYGTETQPADGNDGESEPDVSSATKNESVDVASVFIEYTAAQGSSIGFEYYPGDATLGAGTRTDTGTHGADSGTSSKTYTASADVTDVATVYIEPTYMVNETFGLYGKVGITTMHVTSIESISAGTDSSTYGDVDIWGAMYGIGLKARHSSGMFLKLEGSTTHFRPVRLESNSGNSPSKIYADIDIEAVRLAIGYTF